MVLAHGLSCWTVLDFADAALMPATAEPPVRTPQIAMAASAFFIFDVELVILFFIVILWFRILNNSPHIWSRLISLARTALFHRPPSR